jgi:hypothetical protein
MIREDECPDCGFDMDVCGCHWDEVAGQVVPERRECWGTERRVAALESENRARFRFPEMHAPAEDRKDG